LKKTSIAIVACMMMCQVAAEPVDGVGRLFTSVGRLASCIFPVEVSKIDGKSVTPGRSIFTLSAGQHIIEARVVVDLGICVQIKRSASRASIEPIMINIETGKDYYLGLNASATRRKDWKLEVWRVKGDAFD
jgi:hypothetical protein